MKYQRIIHRLFLTTGLLLGLCATGIGAKANSTQLNQVNKNSNSHNNYTNYTNQNKVQNYNSQLVVNNHRYQPVDNQARNQFNPSSLHSFRHHFNQTESEHTSNQYINNHIRHINPRSIHRRVIKLHNRVIRNGIYKINSQNKERQISPESTGTRRLHLHRHHMKQAYLSGYRVYHHSYANHDINSVNNSRLTYQHMGHQSMFHKRWFRDGLSRQNYRARKWVSWHESNHRWRILSYGGVCVGYFQLNPNYLGYRHGHVDLRKRHQVRVADRYVASRYGNWINAKAFWEVHHWY